MMAVPRQSRPIETGIAIDSVELSVFTAVASIHSSRSRKSELFPVPDLVTVASNRVKYGSV